MEKNLWLVYVALAGLSWGTYVPIIFYGGNELGGKPNARLMAVLCVGVAYFVIGVMLPLAMFLSGYQSWPALKTTGLVFSSLAGVAGAVGAICVIFATKAAVDAGNLLPEKNPHAFRIFIAPLIFGLAPVINVLVSSVWHPKPGQPFHFALELPGWKLWAGIVLVGLGAALVLLSKEEAEVSKKPVSKASPAPAVSQQLPETSA